MLFSNTNEINQRTNQKEYLKKIVKQERTEIESEIKWMKSDQLECD